MTIFESLMIAPDLAANMYRNIYDDETDPMEEDTLGMKVTSGVATFEKNHKNMIGISIGGGSPYCPCLYVVQIFDNTPASQEGSLAAGDELVAINGKSVKGCTKVEVAKKIQSSDGPVTINYNKLHADPKDGKTLDVALKKIKQRFVENISSGAADALGLSRAILTNDSLVKKLKELERIGSTYNGLVQHSRRVLKAFFSVSQVHKTMGDVFAGIGVREPLPSASQAFTQFGDAHRSMEKYAIEMLKQLKPMIKDLNTYLTKAVPDTKLTVKKYLNAKFLYLSYCLKVTTSTCTFRRYFLNAIYKTSKYYIIRGLNVSINYHHNLFSFKHGCSKSYYSLV